jgi:hypothetical protein
VVAEDLLGDAQFISVHRAALALTGHGPGGDPAAFLEFPHAHRDLGLAEARGLHDARCVGRAFAHEFGKQRRLDA